MRTPRPHAIQINLGAEPFTRHCNIRGWFMDNKLPYEWTPADERGLIRNYHFDTAALALMFKLAWGGR